VLPVMATLFRTIKAGRSNDKSGHARVMRCVADKCNGMRPDGEKVGSFRVLLLLACSLRHAGL
jgi:hypothetical protein